jgi:hypothetical protein
MPTETPRAAIRYLNLRLKLKQTLLKESEVRNSSCGPYKKSSINLLTNIDLGQSPRNSSSGSCNNNMAYRSEEMVAVRMMTMTKKASATSTAAGGHVPGEQVSMVIVIPRFRQRLAESSWALVISAPMIIVSVRHAVTNTQMTRCENGNDWPEGYSIERWGLKIEVDYEPSTD